MRAILAIALGLACGFLFAIVIGVFFVPGGPEAVPGTTLGVMVVAATASTWFMLRGPVATVRVVVRVISRGALVAAAGCVVIVGAVVLLLRHGAAAGPVSLRRAGWEAGPGELLIALAAVLAVTCFIVFAIAHFAGRTLADDPGSGPPL